MLRRSLLSGLLAVCTAVVAPATAAGREIIAEVFGQPIYRDELTAADSLDGRIIPPLMQRLVAAKHLKATDAEVADFQAWLDEIGAQEGKGKRGSAAATDEERLQLREYFANYVTDWKINKALYEQYGGVVIFQQANPREAVGAMRLFLEDEEARGHFKIFDEAERARFYDYYRRRHVGVVDPKNVDYSVPWWRQKPR